VPDPGNPAGGNYKAGIHRHLPLFLFAFVFGIVLTARALAWAAC